MLQMRVIWRVFMGFGGAIWSFFMGDERGTGGCAQNDLRVCLFTLICQ